MWLERIQKFFAVCSPPTICTPPLYGVCPQPSVHHHCMLLAPHQPSVHHHCTVFKHNIDVIFAERSCWQPRPLRTLGISLLKFDAAAPARIFHSSISPVLSPGAKQFWAPPCPLCTGPVSSPKKWENGVRKHRYFSLK